MGGHGGEEPISNAHSHRKVPESLAMQKVISFGGLRGCSIGMLIPVRRGNKGECLDFHERSLWGCNVSLFNQLWGHKEVPESWLHALWHYSDWNMHRLTWMLKLWEVMEGFVKLHRLWNILKKYQRCLQFQFRIIQYLACFVLWRALPEMRCPNIEKWRVQAYGLWKMQAWILLVLPWIIFFLLTWSWK